MKETPIIFQGDMVRAILVDRKTNTSRLNGLDYINKSPDAWNLDTVLLDGTAVFNRDNGFEIKLIKCPYGKIGDRLWVREAFLDLGYSEGDPPIHIKKDYKGIEHEIVFCAECPDFRFIDGDGFVDERKDGSEASHWKPSIHMPKWACRLWLENTDIRVERLQDISEEDAKAEGVSLELVKGQPILNPYKTCFKFLWDSITGKKHPWSDNPWVRALSFKRL